MYLADVAPIHTHKRWEDKGNMYDDDTTPNVLRTILRAPSGTASILNQDGTINLALEQTQYASWSAQCWYIEEYAEEKPKYFPPLDRKYYTDRIKEWKAGKPLEVH